MLHLENHILSVTALLARYIVVDVGLYLVNDKVEALVVASAGR